MKEPPLHSLQHVFMHIYRHTHLRQEQWGARSVEIHIQHSSLSHTLELQSCLWEELQQNPTQQRHRCGSQSRVHLLGFLGPYVPKQKAKDI